MEGTEPGEADSNIEAADEEEAHGLLSEEEFDPSTDSDHTPSEVSIDDGQAPPVAGDGRPRLLTENVEYVGACPPEPVAKCQDCRKKFNGGELRFMRRWVSDHFMLSWHLRCVNQFFRTQQLWDTIQ